METRARPAISEQEISPNNSQPSKEPQRSSEKVLKSDFENGSKIKRVNVHSVPDGDPGDKEVTLNIVSNVKDSDTETNNKDNGLVQTDLNKGRINKIAYAKLHRYSFSPTGNSSVDKLKGRYEDIAKRQTDNTLKANIVTPAKANIDNSLECVTKKPNYNEIKDVNEGDSEDSLSKTTSNIEKLQRNLSTKLSNDTIEKLRSRYSPAGYGYSHVKPSFGAIKPIQFNKHRPTNIPVPLPRTSIKNQAQKEAKSNVAEESDKKNIETVTVKLISVPETTSPIKISSQQKDENENNISPPLKTSNYKNFKVETPNIERIYDKIEFAEPEDKHFIERRSSSEDSVDKLESFFFDTVMEKKPKEKKRSNSFRKILTGGFFGKDKKKSDDEKSNYRKKDNGVFADNAQNESQVFDRNCSHRHTIDNSHPRANLRENSAFRTNQSPSAGKCYPSPSSHFTRSPVDPRNRYTDMKGTFTPNHRYNYVEEYVSMDNNPTRSEFNQRNYMNVNKYIDTSSSSSNTLDSDSRNCTYQNALIAQAELRKLKENENLQRNLQKTSLNGRNYVDISKSSNSPEIFRDVSEQSTRNLQLVKPKALIPISSERPLPNPYHNSDKIVNNENPNNKTIDRNLNVDSFKPYPHKNYEYPRNDPTRDEPVVVEDVYGTVFDSISPSSRSQTNFDYLSSRSLSPERKSSSSPSCKSPTSLIALEASKLKLPPNREKVELQPRVKSPIPQAKISTEKIIATELLKNKTSPTLEKPTNKMSKSPSYQENIFSANESRMPNAHSTPQSVKDSNSDYVHLRRKPPISSRDRSVSLEPLAAECLEAAEWQRQQKELDKSPALEGSKKITTNVLVHANPEEYLVKRTYTNPSPTLGQIVYHQQDLHPSPTNVRPHTPRQSIPSPHSKSPDKYYIQQNVEAFYWRELKKLKDKEEQDLLRYRRQQLNVYGYVEDPILTRRSRSVSPGVQRGRRSLSLPRDSRPIPNSVIKSTYHDLPEVIPEGRPVITKQPRQLTSESMYGQVRQPLERNPNFIRNTFERSTIGPIGTNRNPQLYEDYYLNYYSNETSKPGHQPIFKRGSLTTNIPLSDPSNPASKKVSFLNRQSKISQQGWPTKNGFTKSPPTRRIDREPSLDDDVFLPATPKMGDNETLHGYFRMATNLQQPTYQNLSETGGFYDPRNRRDEFNYTDRAPPEGVYGRTGSKQITVSNKVCDIYGQIHEPNTGGSPAARKPGQNYGQVKKTGMVYGQLQQNPSMVVGRNLDRPPLPSIQQQGNFVRGTRLTASANDMYGRYPGERDGHRPGQRVINTPDRPLPPLPERSDSRFVSVKKNHGVFVPVSDTESGSEAGEVQRILQSGVRPNTFNAIEEEWNSDGKSGRASGNESGGGRSDNEGEIKSSRSRSSRREDPRRHTLSGDQHYTMAGQGGPLSRTMDLEGQFPRGYHPSTNAMLFDDDPGIMSEVETSSTGFRRGGKQRSSLPVVRTPSKTLERPLGLVFLQYRNETKRALLPNEITSIDTVKALFVRSFPKQLSMEYLDSPLVKIYIHDSSKDMFYELEDVRSHLREIRDRSVLRLFESTDVSGGLPMGGVGIPGGIGHFEDPSYFSEPEFDSEYQHQHIHKSKGSSGKGAPYYMGSTTSLPRGGALLRPYSPAVGALPPDRLKTLPAGAPPKPQRAYSSGATRASDGSSRAPDRFAPFQRPANPLFNLPDGYMSSPERGSRGYEDPYYSQYTSRSGSITPVIDEEVSDTELLDEQYSLYGVKLAPGASRRTQFPAPTTQPYDTTRLRVEHMERQLANLTGLVQKALTQTPTPREFLAPPGRDSCRSGDEFDMNSSSSSTSLPDDSYLRSDSNKAPKLGKTSCHKSVSFEKSVSFSDEPPDMNSPKQHSPQHSADTKPPKPAIKSSTLPRTSSQEKDRLKPAPPPKPASLSPGQYDGRHIYRDLQLTPEMYNQLRGLQKKAKDLRAEMRNLRRMSQAQAHSVRETIRDTFIKIRAMLMAGGEQVWQAGMDQERVRLSRDEDLYKQEMLRLEKDLTDLEASVEELRGNVINRKTRVNMSDVENMALVLSKSSKTVADLKLRFPGLQDSMKAFLTAEMDKVVREEKFLKEEPERLESALRRCKKLTGTLVTLKRLASVQEQRLPCPTNATDGRISPSNTETPPVTPTSAQHSKPSSGTCMEQVSFGGDGTNSTDGNQRPENALDALLDELQTFSKPHSTTVNTQMSQGSYSDSTPSDPPAIPAKGIPPSHSAHFGYPTISEIGRKGSMDSATVLPTQNLSVTTATSNLRRLHSYPSGSDTDNSPPIQPLRAQMANSKPPLPERNAELLHHLAAGRRVPPPPPPRTSSKSPLASPTSPSLPPRSAATGLQHIQNVQNMSEKPPQSQFEAATQNLGLATLRRNVPNRSSIKDNNKAQTLPRNIGSNLQIHTQVTSASSELQNVSSSSCESVNSQDGTKKGSRKEELEQRHQELLKKQKALQEQYARLQQLQRGNNTLAVVPPAPDQLLKKTGSESNLLQKMGFQMATTQMTGSLTHLPSTTINLTNPATNTSNTVTTTTNPTSTINTTDTTTDSSSSSTTTTSKVYETDIL